MLARSMLPATQCVNQGLTRCVTHGPLDPSPVLFKRLPCSYTAEDVWG